MKKVYENFCTIGQLKKFIDKHSLSDETIIVMQRVEDVYFEGDKGWNDDNLRKEGERFHNLKHHNDRIDSGEIFDKENWGHLDPEKDKWLFTKFTEEQLDKVKTQYYPCWCPVFYDDEFLYLDAHY